LSSAKELLPRLIAQAQRGRLPQTCLLTGPEGVGKRTMCRALAKALLCETGEGCGVCASCRLFEAGSHPDFIMGEPEKEKTVIGVEKARAITSRAFVRPAQGERRVIWIRQADALTVEAQNALLKTLEEPPEFATFLLTAENEGAILPTIRSRAAMFKVTAMPWAEFYAILRAAGVGEEQARLLYAGTGGSAGQALRLARAEEKEGKRQQEAAQLLEQICLKKAAALPLVSAFFKNSKRTEAIEAMAVWQALLRDAAAEAAAPMFPGRRLKIAPLTAGRMCMHVTGAMEQIRQNTNIQLAALCLLETLVEELNRCPM